MEVHGNFVAQAFLVNASVREFAINDLDEAFASDQMVCIRAAIVNNFRCVWCPDGAPTVEEIALVC